MQRVVRRVFWCVVKPVQRIFAAHAAAGVLTERGGMTSHAAVIGQGIGLPCVVGASDINFIQKRLTTLTVVHSPKATSSPLMERMVRFWQVNKDGGSRTG